VVSFGYGCGFKGFPGVYSKVASASDFIRTGVCELSDNPPDDCVGVLENKGDSGSCDVCSGRFFPTGTQLRRTNALGGCREMCLGAGVLAWKLLGWECGSCP
jgi:hypothetical protein